MFGLYFHIPFCKKACSYCSFHFSTRSADYQEMETAMVREMEIRQSYLPGKNFSTIYFGGGTPSLLNTKTIERMLNKANELFDLQEVKEITIEANPDDVSLEKANAWKKMGITRISLGVQSLFDQDLKWMNRIHSGQQALDALDILKNSGYENISADLIFNLPQQTLSSIEKQINTLIDSGVNHLSTYFLTLEEKTKLMYEANKGIYTEDKDQAAELYRSIVSTIQLNGWISYEISNHAASSNYISMHNSSYWNQTPYLGIGPSAHSFDGKNRWMNVANNASYMKAIRSGLPDGVHEELHANAAFNEWVMIHLRTKDGFLINTMKQKLSSEHLFSRNKKTIQRYNSSGHLTLREDRVMLTTEGRLIADTIISDLMIV